MKKIKTANIVLLACTMTITIIAFVVIIAFDNKKSSIMSNTIDNFSSVNQSSNTPSSTQSNDYTEIVSSNTDEAVASVNPEMFTVDEINAINSVIEKYGEGVSVYFEDIDSGNIYTYNQDQKYFIASIIKAPYCMYLYQLASEEKLDLNKQLLFEEKHKQEGTGKLKDIPNEELPKQITIRELISHSIISSDNTAMKILLNAYPYSGYKEYAISLGINYPDDVKFVVNGDATARDSGVYIKSIYEFINTNKYGAELKADMMKTGNQMIKSQYPIARKYGWAELSFHDIAIVYAPHPYVIAICTNKDEGKAEDYKLFAEITSILEKTQQKKYDDIENKEHV